MFVTSMSLRKYLFLLKKVRRLVTKILVFFDDGVLSLKH
jgi:hypothetical protein